MTAGGGQAKPLRVHGREQPAVIPVFPLAGCILLPRGQLPLNIFEPRYLRMVDDALAGARVIGMIQPRDDEPDSSSLYDVGCAGRITSFSETGDGRYLITLTGTLRFRVSALPDREAPYRAADVDYSEFVRDADPDRTEGAVDRERLFSAMREYLEAERLSADWKAAEEAPTEALVNSLSMGCPFAPNEKQALLEAPTLSDRADCLIALMRMGGGEGGENHALQ